MNLPKVLGEPPQAQTALSKQNALQARSSENILVDGFTGNWLANLILKQEDTESASKIISFSVRTYLNLKLAAIFLSQKLFKRYPILDCSLPNSRCLFKHLSESATKTRFQVVSRLSNAASRIKVAIAGGILAGSDGLFCPEGYYWKQLAASSRWHNHRPRERQKQC